MSEHSRTENFGINTAAAELGIVFKSDMTVELVKASASDADVIWAAKVSTSGDRSREEIGADPAKSAGLINYLVRERHGSPFEHNSITFFISAPIFVFREFMRHRTNSFNEECLAGSTLIYFENEKNNGYWKRIDKHWDDWNNGILDSMGRRRKLPSVYSAKVRSYDEETMEKRFSKVKNVIQSGIKKVYRVTVDSGNEIVTSEEHKYFTPAGWKRLKELNVGDEVYTQHRNFHRVDPEKRAIPWSLRQAIQAWTMSQRRIVMERQNGLCGKCSQPGNIIDHVVPVAVSLKQALDIDNLQVLCSQCNGIKTNSEQKYRDTSQMGNVQTITADRIASIEEAGEEMTYDLVLEGPHHNFLGDGFVVHNSGRYRELRPTFYLPAPERKLVQTGKTGHYDFVEGTPEQYACVKKETIESSTQAYLAYQKMLNAGVAKEVARIVLPVNTYSSMYVTMNARSLMHFLSLRTKREDSFFPSYPQREIEMVAEQMETFWAELMPITHAAFEKNGRVSP